MTPPNAHTDSLREQIAQMIEGAFEAVYEQSFFDEDDPDRDLVGSYGIMLDTAGAILAFLAASPPVAGERERDDEFRFAWHSGWSAFADYVANVGLNEYALETMRNDLAGLRAAPASGPLRYIIADAVDDGINAETPEEREAAIDFALQRLRAAPTSGPQSASNPPESASQDDDAVSTLRKHFDRAIGGGETHTSGPVSHIADLVEDAIQDAWAEGTETPKAGMYMSSDAKRTAHELGARLRGTSGPVEPSEPTADSIRALAAWFLEHGPPIACVFDGNAYTPDSLLLWIADAMAERAELDTGPAEAGERKMTSEEALEEYLPLLGNGHPLSRLDAPAPVAGDTDIQNPTVRGERPEQGHIDRLREVIEQQYKGANATGCGGSFGELLCYEIHTGELTFARLAEKWGVSLPTLGELIWDHCKRLESEPRVNHAYRKDPP